MPEAPILPQPPQKRSATGDQLSTMTTRQLPLVGTSQSVNTSETVIHHPSPMRHGTQLQLWSPQAIIALGMCALLISLGSNVYEIHNTALTVQLMLHPIGEDYLLFWKSKYWMLYLPAFIIQIAESLWTIINGSGLDEIIPQSASLQTLEATQKDHSGVWWICAILLGGCILANAISDMVSMVVPLPRGNTIVFAAGVFIAFIFTLLLIGFSMFVLPLSLRIIAYGCRELWKRIGMQWMIFAFEHWGWYAERIRYDVPTQEGNQ